MNVARLNSAGTMLVKGNFEQQAVLQRLMQASGIKFEFTLHRNYSPKEDLVCLYAFGKENIKGLSQYLQEQRKIFGYNSSTRDRLVDNALMHKDYSELTDLISRRIKHHDTRISEFVIIPEKAVPAGLVAGSIQMNYFEKLLQGLIPKQKPFSVMA